MSRYSQRARRSRGSQGLPALPTDAPESSLGHPAPGRNGLAPGRSLAEQMFADACLEVGFRAEANGWPDFAVTDDCGRLVAFVEVKQGRDELRPAQISMHGILLALGFPVLVLRPEEFPRFKRELPLLRQQQLGSPRIRRRRTPLPTGHPDLPATRSELLDAVGRLEWKA